MNIKFNKVMLAGVAACMFGLVNAPVDTQEQQEQVAAVEKAKPEPHRYWVVTSQPPTPKEQDTSQPKNIFLDILPEGMAHRIISFLDNPCREYRDKLELAEIFKGLSFRNDGQYHPIQYKGRLMHVKFFMENCFRYEAGLFDDYLDKDTGDMTSIPKAITPENVHHLFNRDVIVSFSPNGSIANSSYKNRFTPHDRSERVFLDLIRIVHDAGAYRGSKIANMSAEDAKAELMLWIDQHKCKDQKTEDNLIQAYGAGLFSDSKKARNRVVECGAGFALVNVGFDPGLAPEEQSVELKYFDSGRDLIWAGSFSDPSPNDPAKVKFTLYMLREVLRPTEITG